MRNPSDASVIAAPRRRPGEILLAGLAALGLAAAVHAFGIGDVRAAALPCALAGLASLALRGPLLRRGEA